MRMAESSRARRLKDLIRDLSKSSTSRLREGRRLTSELVASLARSLPRCLEQLYTYVGLWEIDLALLRALSLEVYEHEHMDELRNKIFL